MDNIQKNINVDDIVSNLRIHPPERVRARMASVVGLSITQVMHLKKRHEALRLQSFRYGHIESIYVGFKRRIEVLIRKVIRKLTFQHIAQQKDFNEEAVQLVGALVRSIEKQNTLIADLENRVSALSRPKMDSPATYNATSEDTKLTALPVDWHLDVPPSVDLAKHFNPDEAVLYVGCGSEAALDLLHKAEFAVRGIDASPETVIRGRVNGLSIERHDPLEYLAAAPNYSWGGILVSELVHKMSPQQLMSLLSLAYAGLKEGGVLVVDALNPECLSHFSQSFSLNPALRFPIHPTALGLALQAVGFKNIDLHHATAPAMDAFPHLKGSTHIENLSEVNAGIERLNQILFGKPRFTLVARK